MRKKRALVPLIAVAASSFALSSCSSSSTSYGGNQSATQSDGTLNPRDMYFHDIAHANSQTTSHSSDTSHNGRLQEPNLNSSYFNDSSTSTSTGTSTGTSTAAAQEDTGIRIKYALEVKHDGQTAMTRNNKTFVEGDSLRVHFSVSKPAVVKIYTKNSQSGKFEEVQNASAELQPNDDFIVPPNGEMMFDNKPGKDLLALKIIPRGPGGKDLSYVPFNGNSSNTIGSAAITGNQEHVGNLSVYAASSGKESDPYVYINDEKFNTDSSNEPGGKTATQFLIELMHGAK